MVETYFGLIEAAFVFGLAVAFYVWQMRDLRRENEKARPPAEEEARRAAARSDATGGSAGEPGDEPHANAGGKPTA